eukprot:TRINITY_DN2865_c0_g1_i7.p1 TRINITY_DN2865_c0_g1~~TRINITY_DN2865_c0_g1_i7.p1  ORF type:complete len:395 (+),score=109.09 TRINITY_DN2865_c0_g1_i7:736-1920(+)
MFWMANLQILMEMRMSPVQSLFGGVIGQLWIIIDKLNQLLEPEKQIELSKIYDLTVKIISQKIKTPIILTLSDSIKQEFEEKQKLFEENIAEFAQQKAQFVSKILQTESIFFEKPAWQFIAKEKLAKVEIVQTIVNALLDILFKLPSNLEQPDKPKSTNSDQSFLVAKQKVFVNFENMQQTKQDIKYILRIRVPFLTQEEIEEEKKIQEQLLQQQQQQQLQQQQQGDQIQPQQQPDLVNSNQVQQVVDKPKEVSEQKQQEQPEKNDKIKNTESSQVPDKYDEIIDIYDGTQYNERRKIDLQNSRRRDLATEKPVQFSILNPEIGVGLLYDERSQFYFRQVMIKILKELVSDLNQIDDAKLRNNLQELDDIIDENFFKSIIDANKIPIFDYEYSI